MIDLHEPFEPVSDVEALVRSARDYVRASSDLRPRVLETAQAERSERRAQRRIWQVAILVALLATWTTTIRQRPEISIAGPSPSANDSAPLLYGAETLTGAGESNWGLVDSFTELRRRQAAWLRLSL